MRFNEKYGILRCETDPVIDTKLAVIAEMNFPMDDFPVLQENQQAESIIKRLRQIGCRASELIKLQTSADFVVRRVGTENNQFIPAKPGQRG